MRFLIGLCSALIVGSGAMAEPAIERLDRPSPLGDFDRYGDPNQPQRIVIPPRSNPRQPVTQPAYPPEAKAAHQTGTVVMLLTVDETGHVNMAAVDKSSGFESLDEAALNEARTSWHLLPGTVDGKLTTMQYKFAVSFNGNDDKPPVPTAK